MKRAGYWTRWTQRRISRRRMLAGSAAAGAGAAVLACGGGDGGTKAATTPTAAGGPTAASGPPKRGGRYQAITPVDWGTLDPLVSVGAFTAISARIYNALLDRSRTKPDFWFYDLAEEVEQPDEETYNFTIRPGVKIAPNDLDIPERDLDAFDAKVWLDRVNEDDGARQRAFVLPWVDSYEAPDAKSFTMKTKGPYTYFFFRLGFPGGGSIPPREFWEQGISLKDTGVGGGPFIYRPGSYQETGGISLDRNPNYYRTDQEHDGARLPYMDGIDVVRITDRLARRTAFQDRQVYWYTAQDRAEMEELRSQDPGYFVAEEPINTYISFTMNPTRAPWDDARIRKAAMFALDRQEFADRIFGEGGAKPNGLVHWPTGPFALDPEELERLQPYDPQRARALIREATGGDTIRIKVMYPTGVDIFFHADHLPIWKQQMRAAGFDLDEESLDFGSWLARYTAVDYDSSLALNQVYETAETPMDWQHSLGPTGNGHYGIGIGALYPEIDEAIMKSKRTANLEEAAERVKDAQRLIYEKGPGYLPIVSWISYDLFQPFVKNITPGLGSAGQYLNDSWLDL